MSRHIMRIAIFLLLCISQSQGQRHYQLYQEPSSILGPEIIPEDIALDVILPENQDLMILYCNQQEKFVANYHYFKDGNLEFQYTQQFTWYAYGFVNAYWIEDQFLLVVWQSLLIIHRPSLYGWAPKSVNLTYNGTILKTNIVKMMDKLYLIVIENSTSSWIMKKYEIVTGQQLFLNLEATTSFLKIQSKQKLKILISTKNFHCILIGGSIRSFDRIYGFNFDNNSTANFPSETIIYSIDGDLLTDAIFAFQYGRGDSSNSLTITKYLISQDGKSVTCAFVNEKVVDQQVINLKILNNKLILIYKFDYQDYERRDVQIMQQDANKDYFTTQYITLGRTYDSYQIVGKKSELVLLGITAYGKFFGVIYAKCISLQTYSIWLVITYTVFSFILISSACHSFLHFKVLRQFFLFGKMHRNLITEAALILLIHAGIFLLNLQTDTSANGNFQYNPDRSTSPDSFELRMYQKMFQFTALVSVLLESSDEFKAKSTYLGFLVKLGLKTNFYFYYKQMLLIIRGIVYSVVSTALFSFLESFCNPQLRLYPSMEQLALITASYTLCLYTLYNMAFIFAYNCKNYWYFLQLLLSIIFFFSFVTNQFYLNKTVIIEQKAAACLSPITLFSSILQQIFKTEIRFDKMDISSAFLFPILILQPLIAFAIFRVIFTQFFKVSSLELIMKNSSTKQKEAINQSTESEDLGSSMRESGERSLLQVFIPCKLSTNEGFEKVNILRNIKFSGRRGEILTFLDYENASKRTLFEILVNNQQSDKNIERDLNGIVGYSQHVKISIVLEVSPFFGDLSAIERLQLFIRLRQPLISIQQQKQNIEFILNQFNIPEQFRNMKSRELSGGSLKKVALACAFIGNPDVIIIDQPTLGLDTRFRNIFHKKLRQWKDGKLIILGTSDHAEADAVSDKVWILKNGKAIDRSVKRDRRLMTSLKMCLCNKSDHQKIAKLAGNYFKNQKIILQQQCNEEKQIYKINLSIFSEGAASQQLLRQFMKQLNENISLDSSGFFINFSIVDHPYNKMSFKPFKEPPSSYLNELTSVDIQLYHINKVFDDEQDDQASDNELIKSNQNIDNTEKLLNLLQKEEELINLIFSQFQGIFYMHKTLWKRSHLRHQLYIVSIYSWVYQISLFRLNRAQEGYDFVNLLITYCLLHLSLIDLRMDENIRKINVIPFINVTATWLYDFFYLFASFSINSFLQTAIIQAIILNYSEFKILDKILCSAFLIGCFTIFTPILVKIVRQKSYVIAILLISHVCLVQADFNSFVMAYQASEITAGKIVQYFFYPLTAMALYNSLISNKPYWVFIVIMLLQMGFLFLLLNLLQNHKGRGYKKQLAKDYRHFLSPTINEERVLVQNTEDLKEVPIICDNIVYTYEKDAVLSNLYLKTNKGEIYGLLGHNGCGKTTALKIIAGKIIPTHGKASIFGQEPKNMLMNIGYCPQEGLLIGELTVEQNIRLAGALKGLRSNYVSKYMLKLLRYFRLRGIQQVRGGQLSSSQKKKVSIIVALLGFPQLLLFDEVTGSVDPEGRRRILNLIKTYSNELGGTVVVASHDIAEAEEICDRVSILKDGILRKAGTTNSLRAESQHEFCLLILNFARGNEEVILNRQKALIKEYICKLVFVRLESQERWTLAYSLDIRKISILEVWEKVYQLFFLLGTVERFSLRRHGLPEIVKESIVGRQSIKNQDQEGQASLQDNIQQRLI